jgi:hypothetical protein
MAQNEGRTWLTEYAHAIDPYAYGAPYGTANPTLYQAYYAFCSGTGPSNGSTVVRPVPCADAGNAAQDVDAAQASDAGDDGGDGGASEAGDDASAAANGDDAGAYAPPEDPCQPFDDLDVAMLGIDPTNVWVTRMRASLPLNALATDLVLTAGAQTQVSNLHQVTTAANTPAEGQASCETTGAQRSEAFGSVTLLVLTCAGLAAILRRRRTVSASSSPRSAR